MRLVKLITYKRIKTLHCFRFAGFLFLSLLTLPVFSQDNSPYSRYGIGDLVPPTNIMSRGMGGISAGLADRLYINFNNPASFSSFEAAKELKSNKIIAGRAVLDIGTNFETHTLQESNPVRKFVAGNALFSYVQVGIPIKSNWGISFGLRPISRISYKIIRHERLKDPLTGLPIDSARTRYEGDGGAYLVSLGTGVAVIDIDRGEGMREKLSLGLNGGYLFGKKDYMTKRSLLNDSVDYYQANYETRTTFGDLFVNAGVQYQVPVNKSKRMMLSLGAYGNWSQKIRASQDVIRETFGFDDNLGELRLDSIYEANDMKGRLVMPASYTFGFVLQKPYARVNNKTKNGWLIGADFTVQNWDQYRFYGQTDSVRNKWELHIGGQITPFPRERNYFSQISYRAGFFVGPDYIHVGRKLPTIGGSFGMGLPLAISRQAPNQFTIINVAFEYNRRGTTDNILREGIFRFSLGFSLSDIWFGKRKYD